MFIEYRSFCNMQISTVQKHLLFMTMNSFKICIQLLTENDDLNHCTPTDLPKEGTAYVLMYKNLIPLPQKLSHGKV